jgi:hypothetical protein
MSGQAFIIIGFLLFILVGVVICGTMIAFLIAKTNKLMADSSAQFTAVMQKIDTATTAIAERIRKAEEAVLNGGLPAEKEQEILAQLSGLADSLEAMGKSPENPVPIDPEGPADPSQTDEA